MNTTKEQRKNLKIYLSQFSNSTSKEAIDVIDDFDTLEAENARLREALEWIASQSNLFFTECSQAEEIIKRAREALGK